MRVARLQHRFVEYMPEEPEAGVVYVSVEFGTVIHMCCCGCGNQVVTPLSPTDWQLTYDGESISLYPSIGNWSFDCRSHYWIKNNRISWAPAWTRTEIETGRSRDREHKQRHFSATPERRADTAESLPADTVQETPLQSAVDRTDENFLSTVWRRLF